MASSPARRHIMDQPTVVELKALLEAHPGWDKLLLDSITEAKAAAQRAHLRDADKLPETLDGEGGYYAFLNTMVRWIPREDYDKEVLVRLCTFYWLLDQPPGLELQKHVAFVKWMRDFAIDWGKFLNTPESAAGIQTFIDDPAFHADQYMPNPSGWLTFNQFFGREVKPGLRPVAGMRDDRIITSPADSTFKTKFHIRKDNRVVIKGTHEYRIEDLLEGSPYKDAFRGGLFMHAFLGPNDYHRFHAPVRGTVVECRAIQAAVYLEVVIKNGEFGVQRGEFDAPDTAGYEFFQTRGLIIFDSPIGLVAVLPIGMAQVSSVNMVAVEGAYLDKGDEFGYFLFGGSDIIMLFQKGSGVEMTCAPGIHYNVGMAVGEVFQSLSGCGGCRG